MKTFEDCLDELAKSKGWRDWDELFQHQFIGTTVYDGTIITYTKEAALLYGEQKWNEACDYYENEILDCSPGSFIPKKPPFKP